MKMKIQLIDNRKLRFDYESGSRLHENPDDDFFSCFLNSGLRNCHNTAVKRRGIREEINFGRPRANFPRKMSKENIYKTTAVLQNKRKKIEAFIRICKRKSP